MELAWTRYIPKSLHPKQLAFLLLQVKEAFYGGAAGGGKSEALLMGALQYVDQADYAAIVFRRTYADLALPGALMARSREWLGPTDAKWHDRDKTWYFPSGASLSFGYLDTATDRYRYQSAEFQYCAFDELTQFPEESYRYLFSRLRRRGTSAVPLRMRSASNPGGIGHEWVKQRFLIEGPQNQRVFIPAKLKDNPSLDQGSYIKSLAELDPITRAQLLNGDWEARASGGLFRREWFLDHMVDEPHPETRWVRFWDLAATEETGANDPSWTAGVMVGLHDGVYYIQDVRRARLTPQGVEALVKQTAQMDAATRPVSVRMEQEPGSSGKNTIDHYARRVLVGHDFRGRPSTGSKVERARPVSSAAEAGNVRIVRGATWLSDFLDEFEAFPNGAHDDQVDAVSGAVRVLAQSPKGKTQAHNTLVGPRVNPRDNPLSLNMSDPRYRDTDL